MAGGRFLRIYLTLYHPKTEPYKHQLVALQRLKPRDAFALFMDMGTGKTKVIIDEFGYAIDSGEASSLLIVAPAGAYRNWEDELEKHLAPATYKRLAWATWRSGHSNADVDRLLNVKDRPRALIINVEAFSRVERAKTACEAFLDRGDCIMVVDESTTIKNWKAARTGVLIELGKKAKRRRLLSGLPAPKSPLDMYSQMQFLDPKILRFANYFAFRARYAVIKKIKTGRMKSLVNRATGKRIFQHEMASVVVGYRDAEDLRQRIEPYSFRVLKDECLDLPPKVFEFREVELTAEQKRLYRTLLEEATVRLESGTYVNATMVITQMLRLQQMLCGFVTDELGNIQRVPSNRLSRMMELLEDVHPGKTIIWAPFQQSILDISEAITKEYGEGSCARFWGGNKSTRHEEEKQFKVSDRCRFMVSTQGSGGLGNTWTEADLVIYYANDYDLEHRMQSEDRPHRSGQKRTVNYLDMIVRGTVDEKFVRALRKKINLSSVITGDNYKEWLV